VTRERKRRVARDRQHTAIARPYLSAVRGLFLAARGAPLVAILWGRNAQTLKPLLGGAPAIESPHPSPLSARHGFFGSRPFSRANESLEAQGAKPVDWLLPAREEQPTA
jgi:uracil DNA glycosylase